MGAGLDPAPPPLDRVISYGPDPSNIGHLRLPDDTGICPLVIVVHGGYWRARYDLSYMDDVCVALAEAGFATWNIEYRRLGNGGGWPATFLDVAAAADALFRLSPQSVSPDSRPRSAIALGHSAGGHLALWQAARHRLPLQSPLYCSNPYPMCGAVALAGVSSLSLAAEWELSDGAAISLMGGIREAVPERYREASPDELLPLGVRQVLLHGTEDEDVPFAMSERYAAAVGAAGDTVELIRLPGGHFEPVEPATEQWRQVLDAVRRIDQR